MTGEVDKPVSWEDAQTPKVDPPPSKGSARFLRMSDDELTAHVHKAWAEHAEVCKAPGGELFKLQQLVVLQRAELKTLNRFVGNFVSRWWLEVLATPAALVLCTLLALLYWHLHR
jgi:hypothetical protein